MDARPVPNHRFGLAELLRSLEIEGFDALAAQLRMAPRPRPTQPPGGRDPLHHGAVLLILFPCGDETCLILTRRRDDLQVHAGQISFPGGRLEDGEAPLAAALREAWEEVGVDPAALTVVGELAPLYIPPTDFHVHPYVAWHEGRPALVPQEREVAEILEVPLATLFDPAAVREEPWEIRGFRLEVPFYQVGPHKVWGATAMMLSEFVERLRALH
jgi:8-oxo-dGTP pyrophosphatase MutT (NUDIX family)